MTQIPTTLSSIEKAMYKAGYNFMKSLGKTEEEAHEKGMSEVCRVNKIRKNSKPEVWVNLKTGKKITANF
jgi:hypothetical protein